MSNKDIYKDEFGQYHEVEDELDEEDLIDGLEDDEQDAFDDEDDLFDAREDEEEDSFDEDEEYANERNTEYDSDYDDED